MTFLVNTAHIDNCVIAFSLLILTSCSDAMLHILGVLKLDISPPGDKPPYCLTSELQQVVYACFMIVFMYVQYVYI